MAVRSRAAATGNPRAQLSGEVAADDLLAAPYLADPLRAQQMARFLPFMLTEAAPAFATQRRKHARAEIAGPTVGRTCV